MIVAVAPAASVVDVQVTGAVGFPTVGCDVIVPVLAVGGWGWWSAKRNTKRKGSPPAAAGGRGARPDSLGAG